MKKILLILLTLSAFAINYAMAQSRKITGTVTSADDGQPLPGVSVALQGTKQGVLTNGDGTFTLNASTGQVLVFTYVGFTAQQIIVTAGAFPPVRLKADARVLSDVVIKDSYGTQSRKSYTGAAGVVSGAENENKPFSTIQQALQGEVAGVNVQINSGQPGALNQVRIRGISSISSLAASQPLYVIDGMIINGSNDPTQRGGGTFNPLAGINENDIENFTVLKDAAATAIYGSRGSAGVIVINTKRGRAGKTQIRFDAEAGVSSNLPVPQAGKILTPDQYRSMFNEAFANAGYTAAQIATLDNSYALNSAGNNWYDLVTKRGTQQQYNVSLTTGDEKNRVFSSFGYFRQEATVLKSNLNRVTGTLNWDHTINKNFSTSTNLNASSVLQNAPLQGSAYYSSPLASAYFLRPFQLAYNPDGSLNSSTTGNGNFPASSNSNPLYIAANDKRGLGNVRILGAQTIKWNIWDQLKYTGYASVDYQTYEETTFLNPTMGDALSLKGSGTSSYSRYFNWLVRNQLDYRYNVHGVEDFYIDATVGYEAQRSKAYFNQAYATGYPLTQPTLTAVSNAATPSTASENTSNYTFDAIYSRASINYKNLYSLSGSYRRDGGSRFGINNNHGSFYSVGGAWNIDGEDFFKKQTILTTLKLRSSYGTTGNANVLGNYTWRPTAGYGFNYNLANGQAYNTVGNPSLTWESSKKFDIGLDFGFFNDRLLFNIDYYKNKIDGLIQNVNIPWETGFSSGQYQNIGAMQNKGWEFTIKGIPVKTKDFTWNVNFNAAYNANKITKLAQNNQVNGSYWLATGYDYYTYYTRIYAGVDPANGNALWFADANRTTTTTSYSAAARVPYGHADPKITSGFSNNFNYKGIILSVDFYGNFGNRISDSWSYYLNDGTYITGANKYQYTWLNRWTTPGQITDVPKNVYGGGSSSSSSSFSSRFLYYGDYIRLKNLSLGYDFKNLSILKKYGMSRLYLYGRVTNVWTKTYDKRLPFDPEVPINGFNTQDIPQVRTFTIGLNVGF
ncbi:SusC/RagA family TonB-linked outer membrane protein [Mucilaginibacter robiniae]|uniref:SusC/RagA family TonB-linked outer membrane protein n=1 Tax=Mucilaginibacter robiniae TaxID=2728022 RepID=A0A7L5E1G0_9SPHI|nr:SusC/RagA family TonB-linked outer membrane protein [Mucilaginibacter robiniae]QJD95384.1 SusC/RagA family TonB-linked outer membrane protein [Mucilaginibacter robiniae]